MRFLAYYYNLAALEDRKVAVCYKQDALPFGSGIVEMERGGYGETQAFPWQMDTAIARNSWCYTQDLAYKTSKELLQNLVDVVAKNGNLLLNIGPKADGTIPEKDQDILTAGSYTHLTLPTIYSGDIFEGARSIQKKH